MQPDSHLVIESTGETGVYSCPRAMEGGKHLEQPSRCLLSSMWILLRAGALDAPGLCAYYALAKEMAELSRVSQVLYIE